MSAVDAASTAAGSSGRGAAPSWSPDSVVDSDPAAPTPAARYEQLEAVELAFVAAMRHLPPLQRAALILREVFGLSTDEVAEALGTTAASVNSALQRARTVLDRRSSALRHPTLRSFGDGPSRQAARTFVRALERGDVDAIVSLLAAQASQERAAA
jgi:RNA polymerase sigma-70 factor (ECF subfamily)